MKIKTRTIKENMNKRMKDNSVFSLFKSKEADESKNDANNENNDDWLEDAEDDNAVGERDLR